MQLQLSMDEAAVLRRVLENYLPGLRGEVYKTERFEWRESLKQDEAVIKALMGRLEESKPAQNGLLSKQP